MRERDQKLKTSESQSKNLNFTSVLPLTELFPESLKETRSETDLQSVIYPFSTGFFPVFGRRPEREKESLTVG